MMLFRPGVIARAKAAGIGGMVTISTRVAKADTYRGISEAHPEVFFTIGTHPHNAAEEPAVAAAKLLDMLAVGDDSRRFSAIGGRDQGLVPGTMLPPPSPIFPRYVEPEEAA